MNRRRLSIVADLIGCALGGVAGAVLGVVVGGLVGHALNPAEDGPGLVVGAVAGLALGAGLGSAAAVAALRAPASRATAVWTSGLVLLLVDAPAALVLTRGVGPPLPAIAVLLPIAALSGRALALRP